MFTGKIPQELNESKKNAHIVVRCLMHIGAKLKEEYIARMNVHINRLSGKRLGFVHIAMNLSQLIRHLLIFAVLWNVGQHDLKHRIGHCLKNFSDNVFNVVKNFGQNYLRLNIVVASFVLSNVGLILKNLITVLNRVFTVQVYGYRQEREFFYGITPPANNVDSGAVTSMSIIRNLKEMVEPRETTTLSPYVRIVTG